MTPKIPCNCGGRLLERQAAGGVPPGKKIGRQPKRVRKMNERMKNLSCYRSTMTADMTPHGGIEASVALRPAPQGHRDCPFAGATAATGMNRKSYTRITAINKPTNMKTQLQLFLLSPATGIKQTMKPMTQTKMLRPLNSLCKILWLYALCLLAGDLRAQNVHSWSHHVGNLVAFRQSIYRHRQLCRSPRRDAYDPTRRRCLDRLECYGYGIQQLYSSDWDANAANFYPSPRRRDILLEHNFARGHTGHCSFSLLRFSKCTDRDFNVS